MAGPIAKVESLLKVRVADSTTYPGTQTVPNPVGGTSAAAAAVPQPATLIAHRFAEAESALRETAAGDDVAGTIRRHVPEIRHLVNTNRRVLVVWHRMKGPRWLEQGLQCLLDRERAFPTALADQQFSDCVAAFAGALQEHGSADLARDSARLRHVLPGLAGKSFEDALALLAGAG